MTHWLNGPIFGFDVETTGTDVESDRIVTYCVGMLGKPRGWQAYSEVVNPGIPIPEAATKVHGITDEQAAKGKPAREAVSHIDWLLRQAWNRGGPVVAYNAPFDLTILDRELRRHCGRGISSGPVIDPLVLDRAVDRFRKGSRRLADTCKHYGVTLTEEAAHTAAGDAYAAVQLARAVIKRGVIPPTADPDDPYWMPTTRLDSFSPQGLHDYQEMAYKQQRESFHAYLAKKGETPDDDNTVWPLKPWNGDGT